MTPTPDFIWLNQGGLAIEMKAPKPKFSTIRGRIESAVRKAQTHGETKENFLIDLGTAPLTDELRTQLAGYNVGRRRYRISRLWVLSGNGAALTEVELK